MKRLILFVLTAAMLLPAAVRPQQGQEYILILQDAPVARSVNSRMELQSSAARSHGATIERAQTELRRELGARNIPVVTSVKTLLNAVFVRATEKDVATLRTLPGVKAVVRSRMFKLQLNAALPQIGVPGAWAAITGGNPGAGVKIAVIDTGIDQTHPGFQDSTIPMPVGGTKCSPTEVCQGYTSNKVIVARSYVSYSVGTDAATSSPDDLSPRDRVGHGTAAAMTAAGVENTGPYGKISGVAPKAYLGNYKVFGSPGVNDGAPSSAIIQALEDAFADGFDIATMSLGFPAWYGPLDKGAACGDTKHPDAPCEIEAQAVETAVQKGMLVVVAAGNDGDNGLYLPAMSTIHTPGIAPSAITVAASRNAHDFFNSVSVANAGAPTNVTNLAAVFGNGPKPSKALTAALRDAGGLGCSSVPSSVSGGIALIERGSCNFSVKVNNAANAGAVGVVFYCADTTYCATGGETPFSPTGLALTSIPAVMIGTTSGKNLKAYAQAHSDAQVTLDPGLKEFVDADANTPAGFSSRGPSIAPETALKPEVIAPGTAMYMATQRYDTNGEMYSSTRYTVADGTSFSAPLVAGVAALVKQQNPKFTPAQIKSAIVDTATQDVMESGSAARVYAAGAGKVNAEAAVKTNVIAVPSTLPFGVITAPGAAKTITMKVTNNSSHVLNLSVVPRDTADPNRVKLDATTVSPGSSLDINVTLGAGVPAAGEYEGAVVIAGGAVTLRVPYHYVVGDGVPNNAFPVSSQNIDGVVDNYWYTLFRVVDQYGVSVNNAGVSWTSNGGITLGPSADCTVDSKTDIHGLAGACLILGSVPDTYQDVFASVAGGSRKLNMTFEAFPRITPWLYANGIVNGASWVVANGDQPAVAPGSYMSIFGDTLGDFNAFFDSYLPKDFVYLPISLAGVTVSFDAGDVHVPGHLSYAGPGQTNVQVPWELQGKSSAKVKLTLGGATSNLQTVRLADAAPGIFEADSNAYAAAQHPGTYAPVSAANPAARNEVIIVYANGLGPVNDQPGSGELTPKVDKDADLRRTTNTVTATIGGKNAKVEFAGLSPEMIGLYQVNVEVPPDAPTGLQEIKLTVNGNTSKAAKITVK